MSTIRIPPRVSVPGGEGTPKPPGEGGPRIPDVQGDVDIPIVPTNDAFGAAEAPPSNVRPTLGGQERVPVRAVKDLVPPGLEQVADPETLGMRFGSDAALLAALLKPSQSSSSERATRLWAFFSAYAESAAALPRQKEGEAAFRDALKGQGFAELRDANTGKDGVTQGLWVLASRTPDEARERAASVRLEPPPEVRHSEAAARSGQVGDPSAPGTLRGAEAPLRGGPAPLGLSAREAEDAEAGRDGDGRRRAGTNRRLGRRMLWNVLHRFRSDPEDGAVADGQWDRVAFGAMLFLAGIGLVVLALVSL
ncbi:Immediate early protein ICP0 [Myxococcus sp. K15C18031901]|uniref:Immediate early protein ICP0 n=1 Tax=Myxococcus dinghuensis TaxID=2906761 RepID=UPI0020A7FD48|nr:Immediate early protein ICP0 [Myxococcus dinghuensis]MCP3099828.1 Immediate early protein ICP0 [Myxococcus dinghuensis]